MGPYQWFHRDEAIGIAGTQQGPFFKLNSPPLELRPDGVLKKFGGKNRRYI